MLSKKAKNPKTGRPSVPDSQVVGNLCNTLNVETPSWASQILGRDSVLASVQKSVDFLRTRALIERREAGNMAARGEIFPQEQNEIFNYRLELATLYTSAAVVVQTVLGKLEGDIQELKTKYHFDEDQAVSKPEGEYENQA